MNQVIENFPTSISRSKKSRSRKPLPIILNGDDTLLQNTYTEIYYNFESIMEANDGKVKKIINMDNNLCKKIKFIYPDYDDKLIMSYSLAMLLTMYVCH